MPSPSNDVSSVPFALYRAKAKSKLAPLLLSPATTILPSLCTATLRAESYPPKSVVSLPSPSNDVSSVPLVLYLATAKSLSLVPATTILPSLCRATL